MSIIDIDKVEKYISLEKEIKILEKEQDKIKEVLKSDMKLHGINKIPCGDNILTLTESSREKIDKPNFVKYLTSKGLKQYIMTTLEPNMDTINTAVVCGHLTQEEINSYVKITPVFTMKVT